jgi:NitT/TauT family transport system substrate-binding protein
LNGSHSRRRWLTNAAGLTLGAIGGLGIARTADAQSPTALRVGCGQIEPQAQGYYAQDQGLFAKNGLNVTLQRMQFGSATAAAVIGGDLQIGVSNVYSLAIAHTKKLPLVIIASGSIHDSRVATDRAVVAASSPIASAKELNGKIIGCSSVGGLDQLAMMAFIGAGGGDVSTLKFVEVPSSAMADALAAGRIAAAHLSSPDLDAAGTRVRSIGSPEDAIAKVFMNTAWFATADWLAANKPVAKHFAAAVGAAGQWAMAHPQAAAAVLDTSVGVKVPAAKQHFATTLDPALIQVVLDCAARYKMLDPMQTSEFVWNGN